MSRIRYLAASALIALALTAGALVPPASGAEPNDNAVPAALSPTNLPPGAFTGVTPFRALDTRDPGKGPCVSGASGRTLKLTGVGGVPDDAAAVALNVTVTAPTGDGFLTVYPAGGTRPLASNLNYLAGQTVPNMVTVALGTNGSVTLYANNGCPHVIVDIAGWYKAGTPVGDGGFTGVTPFRAYDARPAPCGTFTVKIAGVGGVPNGAAAVALNVTVTAPSGDGFLTVFPDGQPMPVASNLNFVAGQTVPNMVTVALGTNGYIAIYSNNGCPGVIVDIAGWYTAVPADPGGFTGITPSRILDTRNYSLGPGNVLIPPTCVGTSGRTIQIAGAFLPPNDFVPFKVASVALNVTVTQPGGGGFLTVYPAGAQRPLASNLNFVGGQTVPNMVTVAIDDSGSITIYASNGCPHVIVDVAGWYDPPPPCALGAPDGLNHFAFNYQSDGCPLRWESCAPIPWSYNPASVNPLGGSLSVTQVQAAVAAVEAATGLDFVYQGITSANYDTWTGPGLLISWGPLNGSTIGLATYSYHPGETRILWAKIRLHSTYDLSYPSATMGWYDVLLHELGHTVGLAHVGDTVQVMYPVYSVVHGEFETGDLDGLHYVGADQGCLPPWMHATDDDVIEVTVP